MNTPVNNFKDKLILMAAACFLLFFVLSVIQGSSKNKSTASPGVTEETKVVFVDAQTSAALPAVSPQILTSAKLIKSYNSESGGRDTDYNSVSLLLRKSVDAVANESSASSNVRSEGGLADGALEDSKNLKEGASSQGDTLATEISSQIVEKVKSVFSRERNVALASKSEVEEKIASASNFTQSAGTSMSRKNNNKDIPEETVTAYQKSFLTHSVRNCKMKEFGVEFKCDLGWEMSEDSQPQDSSVIVSQDPLVILNWKIFDQKIRFLGQLNQFFFEKIEIYQKGYVFENVNFAGRPAVLVKGFDEKDPRMNRRDYFYLNNEKLVCVSFSFFSEEKEKEGRKIIEEVKASFLSLGK